MYNLYHLNPNRAAQVPDLLSHSLTQTTLDNLPHLGIFIFGNT